MAGQVIGKPLNFQGELPRHQWQDIELAVAGGGGRHSVAGTLLTLVVLVLMLVLVDGWVDSVSHPHYLALPGSLGK